MARGFLSGVIAGVAVSGLGLGALSLSSDVPGAEPPETSSAVTAPTPAPVELAEPEVAASERDTGLMVTAPQTRAPEPEESSGFTGVDTAPAARPEAGDAESAMSMPDAGAEAPVVSNSADTAVTPQAPAASPEAPDEGQAPEVSTQTAKPKPAPEATAPRPIETADSAAPEAQDQAPDLPAPLPDEDREEITLQIPNANEGDVPAQPAPEPALPETTQTARVSIGTPAKTLGSSQSSRLPSLSQTAEGATETTEQATVNIGDLPPIERYAAPFVREGNTPLMSIVLIDDGKSNIGVEALSTFPYPLSFAVDASWDGAGEAMAKYRAQDFEVLAMVTLPQGARASDVEVNLPVLLGNVPEAVGVMETPDAALQASRDVVRQVTDITLETGHGLLLFPKGLNTAQKLAAKEGVPSATVFRDFDGKGQNASSIKRFLNHAALKAGSEGGVVMVGRLRADTISALLLWGLQDRSDRLQLAPISQLMQTAE